MSTFITYDDFKEFTIEKYGKEVLIHGTIKYEIDEFEIVNWKQIGVNQHVATSGMSLILNFNNENIPFNEVLQVKTLTPIVEVSSNGEIINYNLDGVDSGKLDIKVIGFKY